MDFEKLLRVARKNELSKKPVKCLQTKFKPPTKEQRDRDRMLSEGVQKFLARKEEEERRKRKEEEKKKEQLLALRAKDPRSFKRIQTMLKRTKSANKSVMDDAVDNENTADTLAGPSQPDEDDYGFVSETSSELYNKLIQKMYSGPSDDVPKFSPSKKPKSANLLSTKERVKMALLKQEEEERLPHKRKRKHRGSDDKDNDNHAELDYSPPDRDLSRPADKDRDREKDRHKFKKPMPPPVDFHELLKIAAQKQHEPVVYEPKVVKREPEMLMTKKQKAEFEKQQEWKKHREIRLKALENGTKVPESSEKRPEKKSVSENKVMPRKPQENGAKHMVKQPEKEAVKSSPARFKVVDKVKGSEKVDKEIKSDDLDEETKKLKRERDEVLRILKEKEQLIKERDEAVRRLKEREQLIKERDDAMRKLKLLEESEQKNTKNTLQDTSRIDKASKQELPRSKPCDVVRPGQSKPRPVPQDVKRPATSREFPPRDVQRPQKGGREFPPRDVQRKQFPPRDVKRKPPLTKRNRVIESEEEYDSELEDFIDDGDDGCQEDVSKVISEIFRYDKNKYSRYDDEDEECMESNYKQISKEEFYSTKCGLLEDLEDIQREKDELARKKKTVKR